MSYQRTMSTGAIIVAGALLAFSDGSRAGETQQNAKLRLQYNQQIFDAAKQADKNMVSSPFDNDGDKA